MIIGTQCRGPTKPELAKRASSMSALANAFGFTTMIALSEGPFLSYASTRSRYICTSCRHVRSLDSIAAWMSAIVGSCVDSRRNAPASVEIARSSGAITVNAAAFEETYRQIMLDLPTGQMCVPQKLSIDFGTFVRR